VHFVVSILQEAIALDTELNHVKQGLGLLHLAVTVSILSHPLMCFVWQLLRRTIEADVLPNTEEEAVSSDGRDRKTPVHDDDILPNAGEEALSSDGGDWNTSTHDEDVLPNAGEEALSSDCRDWKTSTHDEDLHPNAGEVALSSDGSDGKTSMYMLPAFSYVLTTGVTMLTAFLSCKP